MAGRAASRWLGALLWILAVALMLATAVYQRRTGPTHPARGSVQLADETVAYKLIRSETTGVEARIALPVQGEQVAGELQWRRYPTDDLWTALPMTREEGELAAYLPTQPPAGKLQYRVLLGSGEQTASLPSEGPAVLRYKGQVPAPVLVPHILFMFLGLVWGLRSLLEIAFGRPRVRSLVFTAFGMMLLGGMVLGPAVQHCAFGQAWTGIPFGWDLTDNKTLLMAICWGVGCGFVGLRGEVTRRARLVMLVAGLVMMAVYLVPHSLFGSTLDYEAVDQGADPGAGVRQG